MFHCRFERRSLSFTTTFSISDTQRTAKSPTLISIPLPPPPLAILEKDVHGLLQSIRGLNKSIPFQEQTKNLVIMSERKAKTSDTLQKAKTLGKPGS